MAKSLDGTFDFDENGIAHFLSGPDFTRDVLAQLKLFLEEARTAGYTKDKIVEEAKKLSPSAGELVLKFLRDSGTATVLSFLALVIALIDSKLFSEEQPTIIYNSTTNYSPTYNYNTNTTKRDTAKPPSPIPAKRGSNYTPPKKKRKR